MKVGISRGQCEQIEQSDAAHGPSQAVSPRDDLDRLRHTLETDYQTLHGRLSHSLRSHEKATEALHDAYIRLARQPSVGEVRNPLAYLYRMALNLAANVRKKESRLVCGLEGGVPSQADEQPDPERQAIAKLDLAIALAVLDSLPARRRAIFLARWRDDLSHDEIASRFRIHKRTVQKELVRAERFLRATLKYRAG